MAFEKGKGLLAIATSYSGGGYEYTKIDGYVGANNITITPDIIQDLDSYRNANGLLRRKVLPYTSVKIEMNTFSMKDKEMDGLVKTLEKGMKIDDGKCNEAERKMLVRYYNQLKRKYQTAYCYIPDVAFSSYGTYGGEIIYNPVRIALIGYGEKR